MPIPFLQTPFPPGRQMFTLPLFLFVAVLLFPVPAAFAESPIYDGGVVAADHPLASEAGREILEAGGNAVDAAVAASFALSVVRPYSCGIGGGGFMVVRMAGSGSEAPREIAIDYRESTPSAVGPTTFEEIDADSLASRYSGLAVGVPGTVAGLLTALEKHGTLDRATVIAPAIRLAREGFPADEHYAQVAASVAAWFAEDTKRKEQFYHLWKKFIREGSIREGDRITPAKQADALALIAANGRAGFYEGPVAEAVRNAVARGGGAISLEDLAAYEVYEEKPLAGSFRGNRLLTMPPPSSGGITMQQILGILDRRSEELDACRPGTPDYIHIVTEAMKHAFADRAEWLGDTRFVEVPVDNLLSGSYLDARASAISMKSTKKIDTYGTSPAPPEDGGTSHISVIDAQGNAVACTETINLYFGSHIAVPEYDFFLNNEMDDFLTVRGTANAFGLEQSIRNMPEPGKRPLSSMSPTIVVRDDKVRIIAGASGGPRIISGTTQAVLNVLLFDMDADQAVAAPRFHHQWKPNELKLESGLRQRAIFTDLFGRGHSPKKIADVGVVQLIREKDGGYQAASDPRKGGRPAGIAARPEPATAR
ncbi:MAG: gamma-glutamyltransferase [Gemmatimonadetes bacterium]|nr:gamma-glutamyltransferase [Gemmatimonadota bacterium]